MSPSDSPLQSPSATPRRPQTLLTTLRTTKSPRRSARNSPVQSPPPQSSTHQHAASIAATAAWGTRSRPADSPNSPPRSSSAPNPQTARSRTEFIGTPNVERREPSFQGGTNPAYMQESVRERKITEQDVAEIIIKFFRQCRRSPGQMEFIPSGLGQGGVLIEGNNIGISKEALIRAFTTVRPQFHNLRSKFRNLNREEAIRLMESTTIFVLIDREHLSAINTRRRLLTEAPFNKLFPPEEELVWLTTILTSNLHKHVKAPLLWSHRKWLHERIIRTRPNASWIRAELDIVTRAGEVHPKNYYSWNYARWLVQSWLVSYSMDYDAANEGMIRVVFEELTDTILNWCYSHVSDTSGFSYLAFLYSSFLNTFHSTASEKDYKRWLILSQLKAVTEYGKNIAMHHDSLWSFVRTVLSPGFLEAGDSLNLEIQEQRVALVELLESWSDTNIRYASTLRVRVPIKKGPALYIPKSAPREKAEVPEPPAKEKIVTELSDTLAKRIEAALKNLGKGVDNHAANQIINEIMVKGDEVHWDDIAGLEGAKNALKEVVVYPFLRPDLFSGLREPARGMLLFGPPGTGKTMLARAVATESRSTFFAVSASSLTSKYHGESEKLVRALFAMAKELAPSIIFVDEIDAILSERSNNEHEASRKIKTEFLIHWSDLARAAAGKQVTSGDPSRVLVLAATNMPWAIDEAARRRFVRRQYIPLPEASTRERQFQTLLAHQNHRLTAEDMARLLDLTDGFSGSDITALAKDAAMGPLRELGDRLLHTPVDEIRPIELRDFERSLTAIRASVSKDGLKKFEEWAEKYGERV